MLCSPNDVKVTKLRRKRWAGHVACVGGFRNYMLYRARESEWKKKLVHTSFVHSAMEETSWEAWTYVVDINIS